ncbi:MAG: hypothetical protein P4L69_05705 [Desulfosporosinus sp.]|nr:hypothetical protein [Desulfosporosinus sp.]
MKKRILIICGSMVLIMTLASFWGYNKYLRPDPEIRQQLNNQFGADFFNSFDNMQAVNNSGLANNVKSADEFVKKSDIPTIVSMPEKSKDQVDRELGKTSTAENENIVEERITQQEINDKYAPQFNYLENVAMSRLDTLYSAAIQEYVQNSKAGTLNRPALLQKYIQAGTMLEANIDSQFYSTLNAMQAELIANNLPTDIVNIYKINYEKTKSVKRSQLLSRTRK